MSFSPPGSPPPPGQPPYAGAAPYPAQPYPGQPYPGQPVYPGPPPPVDVLRSPRGLATALTVLLSVAAAVNLLSAGCQPVRLVTDEGRHRGPRRGPGGHAQPVGRPHQPGRGFPAPGDARHGDRLHHLVPPRAEQRRDLPPRRLHAGARMGHRRLVRPRRQSVPPLPRRAADVEGQHPARSRRFLPPRFQRSPHGLVGGVGRRGLHGPRLLPDVQAGRDPQALRDASVVGIVSDLLAVAAAVLAVLFVRKLTALQNVKAAQGPYAAV